MPPHETYIESHLGGGAVLRQKKPALKNIAIDRDPKVIQYWGARLPNFIQLVEGDAVEYLKNFPFFGNELIYSDPPYLPETRRRRRVYTYDYDKSDHEGLLSLLTKLPCMVLISGYESEFYNDMLQGWNKTQFKAKTHTDTRQEVVWFNFPPAKKLHETTYFGSTFRERQVIKRRQQRLRDRIIRMSDIERWDLIRWLNDSYGGKGLVQ